MPGDLIFRIHLKEHQTYERNGLDVYQKIFVDYPTLVLGGTIDVAVISSDDNPQTTQLKIPSGSQLNDVITVRNKGFVRKTGNDTVKGDSYYVVSIQIPKRVNKEIKDILKNLKETMS